MSDFDDDDLIGFSSDALQADDDLISVEEFSKRTATLDAESSDTDSDDLIKDNLIEDPENSIEAELSGIEPLAEGELDAGAPLDFNFSDDLPTLEEPGIEFPAEHPDIDRPPELSRAAEIDTPFDESLTMQDPDYSDLPTARPANEFIERANKKSQKEEHSEPQVTGSVTVPYSLLIEGTLNPNEKELLLSLTEEHKLGFSELDLQPQFDSNRVLLPRISEFAAIFIAQKMRDADVKMSMARSDQNLPVNELGRAEFKVLSDSPMSAAEKIILIPGVEIPGDEPIEMLGSVSATGILEAYSVHAEDSAEYLELLEALCKELKHKAHRKGANVVLHFGSTLTKLDTMGQYRLLVLGTAARTYLV